MTAEHDKDRHDEAALMAVITGEAPPDDALADDAFVAEYRSASADVALLREQLGLIGRALAEPETGASVTPLAARRTRPKPLAVTLKALVAAVGATVVIGMGWLVTQSGDMGADDRGGSSAADSSAGRPQAGEHAKLGHAGYLACARLVVEGTVVEVEPVPGTGQNRVSLDVDRYYKPAEGKDRVVFPMETDVRPGDRVLVGISDGQAEPDLWTTGKKEIARDRAWITAALPQSRTLPCPQGR
ncbi:hypothetical protein ABZ016_03035 [Streptomyces sp. NPDC006372]|uniref:hypothetical protein n=1 Tax=Streptomyces sp. NPDC006372 TaxID=3155599 RepID=UPI0033A50FB1